MLFVDFEFDTNCRSRQILWLSSYDTSNDTMSVYYPELQFPVGEWAQIKYGITADGFNKELISIRDLYSILSKDEIITTSIKKVKMLEDILYLRDKCSSILDICGDFHFTLNDDTVIRVPSRVLTVHDLAVIYGVNDKFISICTVMHEIFNKRRIYRITSKVVKKAPGIVAKMLCRCLIDLVYLAYNFSVQGVPYTIKNNIFYIDALPCVQIDFRPSKVIMDRFGKEVVTLECTVYYIDGEDRLLMMMPEEKDKFVNYHLMVSKLPFNYEEYFKR